MSGRVRRILCATFTCVAFVLVAAPDAGAAQSFVVSPSSGPPGTVVRVSGSTCTPGALPLPDFVQLAATTVPPVTTKIAVSANGEWDGTFTVPASTPATSVVISAVCMSDDVASLTTVYAPQTFVVTEAASTSSTTTSTTVGRRELPPPVTVTTTLPNTATTAVAGAPRATDGEHPVTATATTTGSSRAMSATSDSKGNPNEVATERANSPLTATPSRKHAPGLMWLLVLLLLCLGAGAFVWLWWTRTHDVETDPPDPT